MFRDLDKCDVGHKICRRHRAFVGPCSVVVLGLFHSNIMAAAWVWPGFNNTCSDYKNQNDH